MKNLDLSYNQIKDISTLGSLTALEELSLRNNNASGLGAIKGLDSLYYLSLDISQTDDISIFENLNNLKYLTLSDLPDREVKDEDIDRLGKVLPDDCDIYS